MQKEILTFLPLLLSVNICFSLVHYLLFSKLAEFNTFENAVKHVSSFSFLEFNHEIFEHQNLNSSEQMIGKILLYITIFVSAILLLNFTIAILSDTYSRLRPQFMGLFSF